MSPALLKLGITSLQATSVPTASAHPDPLPTALLAFYLVRIDLYVIGVVFLLTPTMPYIILRPVNQSVTHNTL